VNESCRKYLLKTFFNEELDYPAKISLEAYFYLKSYLYAYTQAKKNKITLGLVLSDGLV
jgi:hypothetical protein